MISDTDSSYKFAGVGLSTDQKPVDNIPNGSMFIEMDTSKIYFFDSQNQQWLEFE